MRSHGRLHDHFVANLAFEKLKLRVLCETLRSVNHFTLNLENLIANNQRFCSIRPLDHFGVWFHLQFRHKLALKVDTYLCNIRLVVKSELSLHLESLVRFFLSLFLFVWLCWSMSPSDEVGHCAHFGVYDALLVLKAHIWLNFIGLFFKSNRLQSDRIGQISWQP